MSLILVVDTEARYVERVRDALTSQAGLRVTSTEDSARALQLAASSPPDLTLVNVEIDGAEVLLSTFGRRGGGAGVIALLPERRSGESQNFARRAEAVLVKPFGDAELRLAVSRCLSARGEPNKAAPEASNRKLTSADIFGDLLAEFQSDAPATGKPEGTGDADNNQLRRKLEETVSGVLGRERKPPPAPAVAPPTTPVVKRPRTEDEDLDALLSAKLNLDRPKPRPAVPPPSPPTPAAPKPTAPAAAAPPVPAPPAPALASSARPSSGLSPSAFPSSTPAPAVPVPAPSSAPASSPVTQRLSVAELAAAEPMGPAFGQYVLLERIAVGGMAEVWKARMRGVEGFQKTVAIKKILPHLTDNSAFVSMFIDEAKLAAQLAHPNITHIYDLGKIGNDYYIAMEFIEGRNLRALLNAARRAGMTFPMGISVLIASRLASALDYAHRKKGFDSRELGLVHRDVSPQNVLISNEGDIKLCDFGIVKAVSKASHTQMGALKGKLQYMSPEQAWGRPVDGRSDLFALGAILYEMLVGRRLFPGDNEMAVLEKVRECRFDPPRRHNPTLPAEVEELLATALAKDPADRFQTAAAMQQALEGLLYAQRPTPTQADLASFVHLLAGAPAVAEEAEPASVSSVGSSQVAPLQQLSWEAPAPPSLPELELPEEMLVASLPEPPAPAPAPRPVPSPASAAVSAPPPIEPLKPPPVSEPSRREALTVPPPEEGPLEIEEGGNRGRTWLVAAILALAVLGVVGWLTLGRKGGGAETAPPAAVEPVPAPTGDEATPSTEGEAPTAGTESAATTDTAATDSSTLPQPSAEDAAALTQLVDQEVARRENEFKRKLEADQRRLEQQVQEAKAAEEAQRLAEAQAAEQKRIEEERRAQEEAETRAREAEAERQREEEARRAAEKAQEAQAAPPPPTVTVGELVRMGPGVVAPVIVSTVKPEYPAAALRLRVEGTVEAEVLVDENGIVRDARITRPVRQDVGLNEAALAAVRAAKYKPATKDGVRVKMWTRIIIPFKLANPKGP